MEKRRCKMERSAFIQQQPRLSPTNFIAKNSTSYELQFTKASGPNLDLMVQFHGDVQLHLALIEDFLEQHDGVRSATLREVARKPEPKFYEDSTYVVLYRVQLECCNFTPEQCRRRLLERWCAEVPLWAQLSNPPAPLSGGAVAVSWERSHEVQLCHLSIGNLVGSSLYLEHHRLSGLSSVVWDHCSQVLSAFVERPGVGVLRLSVALVSFVDSTQLEAQMSIGEVSLEDVTAYQRKHDLDSIDACFPSTSEFGACLTLNLMARAGSETASIHPPFCR
ncbi:uncharacterized protein LOC111263604 [Varroa jacobsoni]|uniref:uncharacterized protein LOC111263604 n=1 Tax=Varroa jacobsoni TaxID=62625 RepID=UPI000BF80821|nr:uncharacterized protein LOC111263604 [Varroa jacobsoni]